jgi:hypothetical protein
MRTLSKFEKKVVAKLCEKHQHFGDIFEKDFLHGLIIEITNDNIHKDYEIKFLIKKNKENSDVLHQKVMFEASEKIVQTINLLNYLKSEAYIFSFRPAHGFSVHGYIGLKEEIQDFENNRDKYVGIIFPDTKTYNFIFEFVDLIFVSTEALKDYYIKGYKTIEQIRHRQYMLATWIAIIISIIIGLFGIFCK